MREHGETDGGGRRILCVTSNFPRWRGDSTTPFILHLAADLQALGWRVDVLAPHAPGAATREVLNGIHVERFRYLFPEQWQTVCYGGGAMVNLRKRPVDRLKIPALVAAEFAAVIRRLVARDYAALHSHWILPQGFTGMLASAFVRIPHVITVHGGDIFSLRSRLMTNLKRLALRSATAVTVNSSFTESATAQVAPDLMRVHRIPMGVDVADLTEEQRNIADDIRMRYRPQFSPCLIFVGRLVEEKGLEDAIRAVAMLRERFPRIHLLVVGDGQDRERLEQLTNQLALGDHVHFCGWVPSQTVRALLSAADVFIGSSRTGPDGWVEAQGLTFLEAMTVGTPVIATKLGGIVDAVRHEETGLLVQERAPHEIAAAVVRLLNDSPLQATVRENAKAMVERRFSRLVSARAFSNLLASVIPS